MSSIPFFRPMLAVETSEPFDSPDFTFEVKWDGFRCIAYVAGGNSKLLSRSGRDMTREFFAIAAELPKTGAKTAAFDGEIVAFGPDCRPDFDLLRSRERRDAAVRYMIFDLVYLNGEPKTALPLVQRRGMLYDLIGPSPRGVLGLSESVDELGVALFQAAKARGLEGIVAKRKESPYSPGKRTRDWLKVRCKKTLDCVILGFNVDLHGRISSLCLGLHDSRQGRFRYVGNVTCPLNPGSEDALDVLEGTALNEPWSPRADEARAIERHGKRFVPVTPTLVCEVEYLEMTPGGRLRHPKMIRLREDKRAIDCEFVSDPN